MPSAQYLEFIELTRRLFCPLRIPHEHRMPQLTRNRGNFEVYIGTSTKIFPSYGAPLILEFKAELLSVLEKREGLGAEHLRGRLRIGLDK